MHITGFAKFDINNRIQLLWVTLTSSRFLFNLKTLKCILEAKMLGDHSQRIRKQIDKTTDPEERKRLALEFFSNPKNYMHEPIGWAEDYCPVRDDGLEIAKAAMRDLRSDLRRSYLSKKKDGSSG